MLRKRFRLGLLPSLLALSLGVGTALGQGQPAAAPTTAATPAASSEAAIWAATASYVYQDDPELKALLPGLLPTTKVSTLEGFKLGLNKAVKLENKKPKDSHVFMFQTKVFEKVQQQNPASPSALAAAIGAELVQKHPERQGKPAFQNFLKEINRLAKPGSAVAVETTNPAPAAVADNPMDQMGAVPAVAAVPPAATVPAAPGPVTAPPVSQWLWVALALSALSLASVIILWNKLRNTRQDLDRNQRNWENSSAKSLNSKGSQPAEMAKAIELEVSRQLAALRAPAKQAKATPPPPAAPVPVAPPVAQEQVELPTPPPAPTPPPVPAPRVRTQYVGEAPFNNSFPARALSDQPGTYSMFAIESSEQQPEQGTFAVTGNLASHVRDHRSVLEPVCEYVGGYPLGSETRVVTEQAGVVRRRGDDWEVVQRARVRFE